MTDPPYGVGLERKTNDFRQSENFDNGLSKQASVFYRDDAEYVLPVVVGAVSVCREISACVMVFTGTRLLHDYPKPDSIGCVFIPNGAGRDRWGFGCFQPVAYYGRDPFLASGNGSRPNSARFTQPGESGIDHPCPKPIEWMIWAVSRTTVREGETVLDPFMGSGTTGIACIRLSRKFVGIEKEPVYFAEAVRRLSEELYLRRAQRPLLLDEPVATADAQGALEFAA